MMPPHIIIVGSLNIDLVTVTHRLPNPGETIFSTSFNTAPGGKGANQAASVSRLSRLSPTDPNPTATASIFGAVGTDEFAPTLLSALTASHVDVTNVKRIPNTPTGSAVIILETHGENRILVHAGANDAVLQDDFPDDFFTIHPCAAVILQLEIPLRTVLHILHLASKSGIKTITNPAPAAHIPVNYYPFMTWLIVNETEAAMLAGVETAELETTEGVEAAARCLVGRGAENVVLTLGGRGCYWLDWKMESRWVGTSVRKEEVVDTTGAGDTFVGALAVAIVEGKEGGEVAVWAGKAAEEAVRRRGSMWGIPWREEVKWD